MIRFGEVLEFSFDGKTIKCRVEKVAKDGSFLSVVEEANTLRIGKPFSMSIKRHNGIEVAEGVVKKVRPPVADDAGDKAAYTNKLEYLIKVTRPFSRVQERNAVRYECYIPATLCELGGDQFHKAHILDISAGGAKILTNNRFMTKKVITIITTLGSREMQYIGQILGIDKANEAVREYKYIMRVKFMQMSQSDEDEITKFIFSEYRKSARKREDKKEL